MSFFKGERKLKEESKKEFQDFQKLAQKEVKECKDKKKYRY